MSNRYSGTGPVSSDSPLTANSRWRAAASCTQPKTGSSISPGESAKAPPQPYRQHNQVHMRPVRIMCWPRALFPSHCVRSPQSLVARPRWEVFQSSTIALFPDRPIVDVDDGDQIFQSELRFGRPLSGRGDALSQQRHTYECEVCRFGLRRFLRVAYDPQYDGDSRRWGFVSLSIMSSMR